MIIKWVILMTYLVTPHESPSTESLSDCATLPEAIEMMECIHTASPEPIVWDTVTELLSGVHDTLEQCQARCNEAMIRWSALRATERKRELVLQCRRVEVT